MKKIINPQTLLAGVFAAVLLPVSQATAKTPDGSTPAIETVCNQFKDDIPGLYGLCVAYCEAQDLDEFDKESNSADSLQNNFERKSGGPLTCSSLPD